jgi:ATP/maltotriose-dependent transcriptional regulator MalT
MIRHVLTYGIIGGLLVAALKWTKYHFLVLDHSVEIYASLIAATFAALGIWLGQRLTRPRLEVREVQVQEAQLQEVQGPPLTQFETNDQKRADLGITPRELEILQLMAHGLSNREIAEKLFVSQNTVKTHSSRLFDKLGAQRRTQAVKLGKDFGLLA